MVTIEEGYVYITNGKLNQNTIIGGITVKIYCGGNVIENGTNDIFFNAIPNTSANPNPKLLNLSKIKEAVTVQGILKSQDRGTNESKTALEQRNDLLTLCKGKQPVTIVWGTYNSTKTNQISYTDFNINKWQFKFVPDKPFALWSAGVNVWNHIEVTIQGLLGSSMI